MELAGDDLGLEVGSEPFGHLKHLADLAGADAEAFGKLGLVPAIFLHQVQHEGRLVGEGEAQAILILPPAVEIDLAGRKGLVRHLELDGFPAQFDMGHVAMGTGDDLPSVPGGVGQRRRQDAAVPERGREAKDVLAVDVAGQGFGQADLGQFGSDARHG